MGFREKSLWKRQNDKSLHQIFFGLLVSFLNYCELRNIHEYSEAHNNLGNLLKDQKKFDEAIYHFDASIKIFPENPSTHNNLGTVHAMKGEISEAVNHFAKAIRIQPTYFDARQNLGFAYMQQGELVAAEREFSQAVEMAMAISTA